MFPPRAGRASGRRSGMSAEQTSPARNGSDERDRRRTIRPAGAKSVRGQRVCDDGRAAALRMVQLQRLPRSRRRRNRSTADGRRLQIRQVPGRHLPLDRRRPPQRNARVARQDDGIRSLADRHLRSGAAGRPGNCRAAGPSRGAHAGRRGIGVAVRRAPWSLALVSPLTACGVKYAALATASPEATRITNLHWLTVVLSALVAVVFIASLAIALVRRPAAETPAGERRRTLAVASAAVVSTLGLLSLLTASVLAGRAVATPVGSEALRIQIVGHQWW